jgi:acyl-CoA reductase-like NAD-dependent aldehyde dehydrogenase
MRRWIAPARRSSRVSGHHSSRISARCLLKIAELMEQHADELATLVTLNNGMAISLARGMVAGAIETFRYCAGWATKI